MTEHEAEHFDLEGLPLDDRSLPFDRALASTMDAWRATSYHDQLAAMLLTLKREDGQLEWKDTEHGSSWAIGLTFATCFLHWIIDHGEEQHEALGYAYPELRQLEEQLAAFAGAMKGVGQTMGRL